MAEGVVRAIWAHRGLYVLFAALVMFARMLPLSTLPTNWPGPDLLVCLTFAWVLRRPEYVPALLVAAIFFLEDMLVLRPPGLWAVLVLMGVEFLRGREPLTRELPFPLEWAMVSGVILVMMLANRLVLLIVMTPQPGFALAFLQIAFTIVAYPVIVVLSGLAFGVRKAAPGEVDARGRRL